MTWRLVPEAVKWENQSQPEQQNSISTLILLERIHYWSTSSGYNSVDLKKRKKEKRKNHEHRSESHLDDSLFTLWFTSRYVERGWGTPSMTFVRLCMIGIHKSQAQWKTLQSTRMWSKLIGFFYEELILFQVCMSIYLLACGRVLFWLEGSISYRDSPDLQLCVDCFLISIRAPSK